MPEYQVIKGFEEMVNKGKGIPMARSQIAKLLYHLEIAPITHSKVQRTLIAESKTYTYPKRTGNWTYAPDHWVTRADEGGFGHLMAYTEPAPLVCRSRGKSLLLAVGPHAMVVCFALETCIIGMSLQDYQEIISNDIPGPNPDPEKAEHLRTFQIPDRLIMANSSPKRRTIKIVAALVSDHWVWTINDWTSLVRLYVYSTDGIWTTEQLAPGTEIWKTLFNRFNGGPDWVTEKEAALKSLSEWREFIIREWKKRKGQTKLTQFMLSNSSKGQEVQKEDHIIRPIVNEMQLNTFGCFAGVGLPSFFICADDEKFSAFQTGIYNYMLVFTEPGYLKIGSSVPNTLNPIAFNEHGNTIFTRKYVYSYHRTKVRMAPTLYNTYVTGGLFNDAHIIGNTYLAGDKEFLPIERSWKEVPIYFYGAPLFAFTAVRAQAPENWGYMGEKSLPNQDIKEFGYKTRMGPFHFRVQLLNRPDYHNKEPGTLINGRPKKNRTGKVGRPAGGITKKKLTKLFDVQSGRIQNWEEIFCENSNE